MKDPKAKKIVDKIVERRCAVEFWRNHIAHLQDQGLVSVTALQALVDLGVTNTKNIGYREDQFRPGKILGQIDVFHALMK